MTGILTFWGVPNYGAFAQAYALNLAARELTKREDIFHAGYLHERHHNAYSCRKKPARRGLVSLANPHYWFAFARYLLSPNIHYAKFEEAWSAIPHIPFGSAEALEEYHWETLLLGSDSIWEYSVKDFGDDVHLIGNRLNAKKIVSYAASFGDMNPDDDFPDFVREGLLKQDRISVRDENSAEIVNKLTGRSPDVVLDPTFLWDFQADKNIPIYDGFDYILVYGYEFSERIMKEVRTYAEKNHVRIIGAGLCPGWVDAAVRDLDPLTWIGMFANARFVLTSTFHGLMFSIHYQKKFYFQQVEYVKNRSQSLLERIGMSDLFHEAPGLEEVLNTDWDYQKIREQLHPWIQQSKDVLVSALNE